MLLSEEDLNVDAMTVGGMTPLMYAVETGKLEVVASLLNAGCNPFAASALGETALDFA